MSVSHSRVSMEHAWRKLVAINVSVKVASLETIVKSMLMIAPVSLVTMEANVLTWWTTISVSALLGLKGKLAE